MLVKKVKREFPETHAMGHICLENLDQFGLTVQDSSKFPFRADLGVQIARDGRVWICINGVAFLRFKPV